MLDRSSSSRRQFLRCAGAALAAAPLARPAIAQIKLRDITMRLDWVYQGPNAGFMMAQEKGFYKEAGLNVDLGPGKGSGSTAQLVASKATQFGFSDGYVVGLSVSKGMNIRTVAGIYRRNPTGEDRKVDADEAWIRIGDNPLFLDRPSGTSVFLQLGKMPHVERQPIRLLESYGLAATAFNRFEDVQAVLGGSVGRNLYWRVVGANGNPLYFRDPNALAGDNGISELLQPNPDPHLKSGFPILYNTETEDYFFKTHHFQFGQGLGYKWQNDAQTFGFDAIAFHYRRKMVFEDHLTGTFYGAELDLLDGPDGFGVSLPVSGNKKEETGARVYVEWRKLTSTMQYTKQHVAGLGRTGWEGELGYRVDLPGGSSVMPVVRVSGLTNDFRAKADKRYPAPSVWWPWTKIDYGIRIGLPKSTDLTIEHAKNNIGAPIKVRPDETLVTVRVRI